MPKLPKSKKTNSNKPPKKEEAPIDPKQAAINENMERYMPYLEEIQKKLFWVLVIFFLFGIIGAIYYQEILRFVMGLFNLSGINIVMTSPYQFISLAVNTGIALGIFAALMPLLYHLITFLRPALEPPEYRLMISLIPTSFFLFFVGFGFGVWVVQFVITLYSKTTIEFAIGNLWDIGSFFSQIMLTGALLAVVFQLPIVVTALIRLKVVEHRLLAAQRRYVYAFLLLFAALMPPTDILSLILLTIPPLFLFEIALLLNHPLRTGIENQKPSGSRKSPID